MAMVGKVVAMIGVATIIKANGETRQLQLGDSIEIGDAIQTPAGVEVELELVSGRHIYIGEIQLVAFTEEFSALFLDRIDSAVSDATIETVIKAIDTGRDINEVLEETAAGEPGNVTAYGFNFVDLLRFGSDVTRVTVTSDQSGTGTSQTLESSSSSSFINNAIFAIAAPGGTTGGATDNINTVTFADERVNGVSYTTSSGLSGLTGDNGVPGQFQYRDGDTITFRVGNVIIGEFSSDIIQGNILFLQDIAGTTLSDLNNMYVENMAIFLQAIGEGLQDNNPADGVLNTNQISLEQLNTVYANEINITQAMRDLFATYEPPINLSATDKVDLSRILAHANITFTAESEKTSAEPGVGGANAFETAAMEHVRATIEEWAGDRTPDSFDARQADVLQIPPSVINYAYDAATGKITFDATQVLENAVGHQSRAENLVVSNLVPAGISPNHGVPFSQIADIVRVGASGNIYEIVPKSGYTAKDLEGLQIGYTASDWTVSITVTAGALDTGKAHLSAVIPDVTEDAGFNVFEIKSSLTFSTNQQLIIDFTSELVSTVTKQYAEYADDYSFPLE